MQSFAIAAIVSGLAAFLACGCPFKLLLDFANPLKKDRTGAPVPPKSTSHCPTPTPPQP